MRLRTTALSSLLGLVACTRPTPEAPPRGLTELSASQEVRLSALLAELTSEPLGTGASLTVSTSGRLSTLVTGRRWQDGPPVVPDTTFNVASVSKVLTAAKVLELVHARGLDLDDTVQARLPGIRLLDDRGQDRARDVTVRMLLKHLGGLPHQPVDLDPARLGSSWVDPALLTRLSDGWSIPLARAPNQWGYSNVGYALLGAIIERAEGRTFADAMRPYLAAQGMSSASFWPADVTTTAARGRAREAGAVVFREPDWYGSRYALPFNGLFTSTPDLARFGQRVIAAAVDPQAALHPMTVPGPLPGQGLGPVLRVRHRLRTIEHDGGGPGFMAWLVVLPEREAVLALTVNADGEDRGRAQRVQSVMEQMLEVVLGE